VKIIDKKFLEPRTYTCRISPSNHVGDLPPSMFTDPAVVAETAIPGGTTRWTCGVLVKVIAAHDSRHTVWPGKHEYDRHFVSLKNK